MSLLKRLNDLWNVEKLQVKERLVKEVGLSEKWAEEELERVEFFTFNIPKQFLWDEVTKDMHAAQLFTPIIHTACINTIFELLIPN